MDFKNKILAAKQGEDIDFTALLDRYRRKIKYFSYFDGKYDEDLESELYVTFLNCVRAFDVEYNNRR